MKSAYLRILILVIFLFPGHRYLHAEVYKWTDADGNIIYGDSPPSRDAKKMRIKKSPATDGGYQQRLKQREKLLDVMQEERQEKAAKQQQAKAKKAEKKATCQRLLAELKEMQNASFLYEKTDDPFNPNVLSDERRKQEEKKYQDYIDDNCR